MDMGRRLHPIGWFVAVTSLLWLVTLVVPRVLPGEWYAGYPFFPAEHAFTDLTIFRLQFFRFRQPDFYWVSSYPLTYPAPAGVLLAMLYGTGHAVRVFTLLVGGISVAGLTGLGVALRRAGLSRVAATGLTVFLAVTAYPLFFCLLRGNIEFFNCALMATGMALCWKKRWGWGGVLLGLAAAFKLYPVVLLGYPLAQRKFRAVGVALGTAAVATLTSLEVLGPTVGEANRQIARGLLYFKTEYVILLIRGASAFDHSIFGAYKLGFYHLVRPEELFPVAAARYSVLVLVVGLALYFGRVVKLPAVSQVVVLTALAMIAPPVSYDYTLLLLYVPWTLLAVEALRAGERADERGTLVGSFVCLALAMAPLTFLRSAAGPIKCAALVALVALHCARPVGRGREAGASPAV